MATRTGSSLPSFMLAGIALLLAVVTGVEWLGKPLRLVHLVTIIGMSMAAGVFWMQAILHARQGRSDTSA